MVGKALKIRKKCLLFANKVIISSGGKICPQNSFETQLFNCFIAFHRCTKLPRTRDICIDELKLCIGSPLTNVDDDDSEKVHID